MSLYATVARFAQVLINWFWIAIDGSWLHRGLARLLYFPSILRMTLKEGPNRRWYDRIDNTVILGALPFRSQTKKVSKLRSRADLLDSCTYGNGRPPHLFLPFSLPLSFPPSSLLYTHAASGRRECESCALL